MADVSQVIQMQRLRASAARRPAKNDKSITHLYQPQITSSGISEFLPNSKTKITDARTIKNYYYVPGVQAKPKVPTRNAYGILSVPSSIIVPPPPPNYITIVDLSGIVLNGISTYQVGVFGNNSGVDTQFNIQFTNIDPSFNNLGSIIIRALFPATEVITSTDTISYTSPNYIPVTNFTPGPNPTLGDSNPPSIQTSSGPITTSTIMTITTTNRLNDISITFV
jgi:hypothetical protein